MIGIDTNVLVRYFIRDDREQFEIAARLLEQQLTQEEPGFINVVTIAEILWVLTRSYRIPRDEIVNILELMLQSKVLVVQNELQVYAALVQFKAGRGSFADLLIGELNLLAGCSTTITFDRKGIRA